MIISPDHRQKGNEMAGAARFRILARTARLLALLCFLLPFVTVSCSSRALTDAFNNAMGESASPAPVPGAAPSRCTLIRATGLQLALGAAELSNECIDAASAALPASGPRDLAGTALARADPAVILAAALILLTLLLGLTLKAKAAAVTGVAGSALAILALIYAVFLRLPRTLYQLPRPPSLSVTQAQLARILEVGGGIGFWLALLFLALAIGLDLLALNRKESGAG
jgi:hypothetical protein